MLHERLSGSHVVEAYRKVGLELLNEPRHKRLAALVDRRLEHLQAARAVLRLQLESAGPWSPGSASTSSG